MLDDYTPYEAMLLVSRATLCKCYSQRHCLFCGYEIFCSKLADTYKTILGLLSNEERIKLEQDAKNSTFYYV